MSEETLYQNFSIPQVIVGPMGGLTGARTKITTKKIVAYALFILPLIRIKLQNIAEIKQDDVGLFKENTILIKSKTGLEYRFVFYSADDAIQFMEKAKLALKQWAETSLPSLP
jgi:hypothetical protein